MSDLERHFGEVVDNEVDLSGVPLQRGEIMVKCETILSDERVLPDPVPPSFPIAGPGGGVFFVPEIGSEVELIVIGGASSVENPEIRYVASLYSEVDDIPDEFKENYPKRWGIKTPGGQLFYFDFTKGAETVVLDDGLGQSVKIDSAASSITLTDKTGNEIRMESGGITINSDISINLGEPTIDSVPYANVLAGFLQQFAAWAGSHIHPHPQGPTSGPTPAPPAIPDATAWSSPTVKLK